MSLETAWLALLGFLLCGYFALGGYDYGVQMLQPIVGRDGSGRKAMLGALGPFFLGNEVWLVAFAGVLFGAFPFLEGTLLGGMQSLVVAILIGIVVGNAAVQLRSRSGDAGRKVWDGLVVFGGLVPALAWGLFVGVLLNGVPMGADHRWAFGLSELANPFVLLSGVTGAVLFAAHGATFLALRTHGDLAERAAGIGRSLLLAAIAAFAVTFVVGTFTVNLTNAVAAVVFSVLVALALVVARFSLAQQRPGRAFGATSVAAALPVLLLGFGQYPYVLVSSENPELSMTVSEGAADTATLGLLTGFGVVLIPVIIAYQAWSWWTFRGRVDQQSPSYF
ncbi:cytochrome d ubiquinol oxidase subunit II [Saccharopolyspora taberi]|uniref:Cytochrome d ubiquinol oxidase subunit II n=1 Tax=Saccharopolyspora taberi TaxID=60895 RepID=A0ABN3VG23_9PSEU